MKNKLLNWVRIAAAISLVTCFFTPTLAHAAPPDAWKVTMSDSRPSTAAVHTAVYDETSTVSFGPNDTITITYAAGFNLSSILYSDITFNDNGTAKTTAANCSTTTNVQAAVAGQAITFTACSAYSTGGTGGIVTMTIGGTNKITNATAGTYSVTLSATEPSGGAGDDDQITKVVVLAATTATATIAETLTFTVGAVNNASCQVSGGSSVTTTATTVPFGTISSDTFYNGCQSLTTGTNGSGGYTVTVQTTGTYQSGGNIIAKGTCDGSCSDSTAAAWATAASHSGYGYCMIDVTGGSAAQAADANWGTHPCGASQYFKTIANAGSGNTAQAVMTQSSPTSTNNVSNIGYRMTVGPGQAAGTYTTIAVYIATPTF